MASASLCHITFAPRCSHLSFSQLISILAPRHSGTRGALPRASRPKYLASTMERATFASLPEHTVVGMPGTCCETGHVVGTPACPSRDSAASTYFCRILPQKWEWGRRKGSSGGCTSRCSKLVAVFFFMDLCEVLFVLYSSINRWRSEPRCPAMDPGGPILDLDFKSVLNPILSCPTHPTMFSTFAHDDPRQCGGVAQEGW